jgi:hypothetical protein
LLTLFFNNLLPILLSAGAGFVLSRSMDLDPRSLSRAVFYIFAPCLVFTLLFNSSIDPNDAATLGTFTALGAFANLAIAWGVSKVMKLNRKLSAGLMLATLVPNAGNYGLSLNNFAFGEEALAAASIFFVTTSVILYTVGILIASMGETDFKESLAKLISYPTLYAVVIAFVLKGFDLQLPIPLDRSITVLGDASIPTMLIVLGIQLGNSTKLINNIPALTAGVILRLVASPMIAILIARVLGMQGSAYQAGVVESAMPTAVMTTILATEFDTEPAFVTAMVTMSTLLSPLTVTPLLAFLGA